MGITSTQDKAFDALIFFAERVKPLYLSMAMKLLYLADEKATKDSGVPITWLTYKAWKSGPIAEDIFFKVTQTYELQEASLKKSDIDHVVLVTPNMGRPDGIMLTPKRDFDDSKFSDISTETCRYDFRGSSGHTTSGYAGGTGPD